MGLSRCLVVVLSVLVAVAAAGGGAKDVNTKAEFDAIMKKASFTGLPVIIDFHSQSCGPCHMIAPAYKALADEYKGKAIFLKVDVERNHETSSSMGIRSMPTFQFYSNGKKVPRRPPTSTTLCPLLHVARAHPFSV